MPVSHGEQLDWPVAPWYRPVSQSVQVAELAFAAYLPVPHASQLSLPFLFWYRPFSQSVHSAAPAWLALPAEQSTHTVVLVTFEMPEVVPAGHVSQLSDPSAKVVRPASHAVQPPAPAWLNVPVPQLTQRVEPRATAARLPASHESQLSDPVALTYLPVSHGEQLDWPVAPWYRPALQSVQVVELAFAAYLPAPHASQLSLPFSFWDRPISQSSHSLWPVPPCALPVGQSVQPLDPLTAATFPAPHDSQLP